MTHTPADAAIWAAQLADMPMDAIVAFVREQGHAVRREPVLCAWCAMALDSLPVGYPPMADEEDGEDYTTPPPHRSYQVNVTVGEVRKGTPLPFDAEEDRRP